jgi:hypothetical protein
MKIVLGSSVIEVRFSPIFPGNEAYRFDSLQVFGDIMEEFVHEVTIDVLSLFVEYILAKTLSFVLVTWVPAVLALLAKGATQFWLLLKDWNDQARMLAVALVNILMALIACETSVGAAFINALFLIMYGKSMSALYLLESGLITAAAPITGTRTLLDVAEVIMDLAFGVTAWERYAGRI